MDDNSKNYTEEGWGEYEAQRRADELLRPSQESATDPNKYATYQPPTTRIVQRSVAEDLIIVGETFLRVESAPEGEDLQYLFAGTKPAETAKAIVQGKLSIGDSPRSAAARNYAQWKIQAAIVEHRNKR